MPTVHEPIALEVLAKAICGYDFPAHFKEWGEMLYSNRRLLMVASRDHGKSTLLSKLYPIAKAISKPGIEILIVSYSESQAMKLITGMEDLFEKKDILKTLVPKHREEDWSKTAFKLRNGSRVDSLTFGTSGRGGHYDLVIVDDPIKDFGGMDPDDQEDYFLRAIVPMCKPDGQIVVIGTFVYENDLIERLQKNKAYHCAVYPAIKDGKALWPERWPIEKLEQRKTEVGEYAFAREYLLQRLSPGTQFFRKEMVRYYDPAKLPERMSRLVSVDPAISVDGDYTAIVATGTDEENKTRVLDYVNLRTDDVQHMVDEIFRIVTEQQTQWVQIETIGFQRLLKQWLWDEMRKRNVHFGIEEIKHHAKSKEARIMALQPRIANGSLLFHPSLQEELINQFMAFPHGLHDDMIDALSMQVGRWDKPHPLTVKAPANSWEWWKAQAAPADDSWYGQLTNAH